jgi:hypothetical protein
VPRDGPGTLSRVFVRVHHGVLVAAALGVVVAATVGHAGATGYVPGEERTAEFRSLRFRQGEVLTISLHPVGPIQLVALNLDLEVCPRVQFPTCTTFDHGTLTIPAPGGMGAHITITVRGRSGQATGPGNLSIRYPAGDPFFIVAPPPLDPGRRGPIIEFTPGNRIIAAGLTGCTLNDDCKLEPGGLRLVVRQGSPRLHPKKHPNPSFDWPTYSPVQPDRPITVRARNDGETPTRAAIALTWGWTPPPLPVG